MAMRVVHVKILRSRPGAGEPPRLVGYELEASEQTTVLDALEQIRLTQDPTLMYRHSCHHSSCGTCACIINGIERLACTTRILELGDDEVKLEPLRDFEVAGDLAVRMERFYRDIEPQWSYLKPCEAIESPLPGGPRGRLRRFEDCIECGACVSVCPATRARPDFMGPAALAAIHNEILKNPAAAEDLQAAACGPRGERWCERALACSRVCPTGVNPARHILSLRRRCK